MAEPLELPTSGQAYIAFLVKRSVLELGGCRGLRVNSQHPRDSLQLSITLVLVGPACSSKIFLIFVLDHVDTRSGRSLRGGLMIGP